MEDKFSPNWVHAYNAVPIKINFLGEIDKLLLNIVRNGKGPRKLKTTLKKNTEHLQCWFQDYSNKTVQCWLKSRHTNHWNTTENLEIDNKIKWPIDFCLREKDNSILKDRLAKIWCWNNQGGRFYAHWCVDAHFTSWTTWNTS